ncbi:MAG TPA: hypothetical protein VF153_09320 [Candidatus Limnocylindria bacterium]
MAALGRSFCHDDRGHDCVRSPTKGTAHARRKAALQVEAAQKCLRVDQDGLNFDDQEDVRRRVEGEDVNASSLAEMVEAGLGAGQPADAFELADQPRRKRGMIGIE